MGHYYLQLLALIMRTGARSSLETLALLLGAAAALSATVLIDGARAETAKSAKGPAHAPAPNANQTSTLKLGKEGEMDISITGKNRAKLAVGKLDPPAAFNLEDIQNFPEDRLQPILNSRSAFDEGRDFPSLTNNLHDQPVHPWLPEIARAPFLEMDSPAAGKIREWSFAVIDQTGNPVATQEGKGSLPKRLSWDGEDSRRGHAAADIVYVPQLSTVDTDGYHHTFMGAPSEFASLLYAENGKTRIEVSNKRLFIERKAELSKEAPFLLDKVCDAFHEGAQTPFTILVHDADASLASQRQEAVAKYLREKLSLPESSIQLAPPASDDKRGSVTAILIESAGS